MNNIASANYIMYGDMSKEASMAGDILRKTVRGVKSVATPSGRALSRDRSRLLAEAEKAEYLKSKLASRARAELDGTLSPGSKGISPLEIKAIDDLNFKEYKVDTRGGLLGVVGRVKQGFNKDNLATSAKHQQLQAKKTLVDGYDDVAASKNDLEDRLIANTEHFQNVRLKAIKNGQHADYVQGKDGPISRFKSGSGKKKPPKKKDKNGKEIVQLEPPIIPIDPKVAATPTYLRNNTLKTESYNKSHQGALNEERIMATNINSGRPELNQRNKITGELVDFNESGYGGSGQAKKLYGDAHYRDLEEAASKKIKDSVVKNKVIMDEATLKAAEQTIKNETHREMRGNSIVGTSLKWGIPVAAGAYGTNKINSWED